MSLLLTVVLFWTVAALIVLAVGWLIGQRFVSHPFLQRLVDSLAQDEPEWMRKVERDLRERDGRA